MANVNKITLLIRKHLKSAAVDTNIGSEMSFILPEEDISQFSKLLKAVESNVVELGITGSNWIAKFHDAILTCFLIYNFY